MSFSFEKTSLNGLYIIKPPSYIDSRGFFMVVFAKSDFEAVGLGMQIVQINQSSSARGVLRGLHFQHFPYEQAKLVRCIKGEIFDVAVDIRPESPSFGRHFSVSLTDSNKLMLFVPRGFAHGFTALSEDVCVEYAVDNAHAPGKEGGIIWNDPDLSIEWPFRRPTLSEKDGKWPRLREIKDSLQRG
jgi:dTDP-4-dehydrorhamnose 3,5-epimerase